MLSNAKISKCRKQITELTDKINLLAHKCAHQDPLIKGSAGEVFRICGKKSCKCSEDASFRHGPYKVVQVYKNGKQRQISLRKDQADVWHRAKHYQQQIYYVTELKSKFSDLEKLVKSIIDQRIEEFPK